MRIFFRPMLTSLMFMMATVSLSYAGNFKRYSDEGGHPNVEKDINVSYSVTSKSEVLRVVDKYGSPTDTYVRIQNGSICDETTGARNVEAVFYSDVWGTIPKSVSNLTIKVRRQLYDLATNTETYTYPTFVVSGYSATIVYCEVQEGMINGAYVETRYNPENFEGADYTAINW